MSYWLPLFSLLVARPEILGQQHIDVKIRVSANFTIAETDDNFVCATIDWLLRSVIIIIALGDNLLL